MDDDTARRPARAVKLTAPGITIGGCRLGAQIGRGGIGVVYRAVQLDIDRPVAVKLVPVAPGDVRTIARFRREAHAAGRLDHAHSLPIYAAGEEEGLLYLVMRLVNGPDLAALIAREGPLEPARAVTLVEQVAGALDEAHAAGLVHRDLKPANILIEPRAGRDHAFLGDFGLMRGMTDPHPVTAAGEWVGTPEFASPEQQRGDDVGPATDIYALAGVLAAMLGPEPPPPLGAVIAQGMARRPQDRYRTASELAGAARAALDRVPTPRRGSAARNRTPPPPRGAAAPTAVTRRQTQPRSRRRLASVIALLVCVVAAAVVIAILTANSNKTPRRVTVASTPAFRFQEPAGWHLTIVGEHEPGYTKTVSTSPDGTATVTVDRNPGNVDTPEEKARAVERATAPTPGYSRSTFVATTLNGEPVFIWAFTLAGADHGARVDVFRVIGGTMYAVLGSSSSLATSRTVATLAASTLTAR